MQAHLRTITSFVELIEEENKEHPNDTIQTYVDFVNEGLSRMKALTTNILHYAQLNSEKLTFSDVDLEKLIEETKQTFYFSFKSKKIKITCQKLPLVKGDEELIRQLLQNVIGNSIKFSHKPVIEISAESSADACTIAIRDNGIGIDKEKIPNVFRLFERSASKKNSEGAGIGLSFVQKIMELHGGKVWIDSEKGKGTTVFLSFPKVT